MPVPPPAAATSTTTAAAAAGGDGGVVGVMVRKKSDKKKAWKDKTDEEKRAGRAMGVDIKAFILERHASLARHAGGFVALKNRFGVPPTPALKAWGRAEIEEFAEILGIPNIIDRLEEDSALDDDGCFTELHAKDIEDILVDDAEDNDQKREAEVANLALTFLRGHLTDFSQSTGL